MKVAKATQKPGQTKEQTKLIAQGIEKGIAEYKKQQSKKQREKDKQHKQKVRQQDKINTEEVDVPINNNSTSILPWALLVLSWIGFIGYITVKL